MNLDIGRSEQVTDTPVLEETKECRKKYAQPSTKDTECQMTTEAIEQVEDVEKKKQKTGMGKAQTEDCEVREKLEKEVCTYLRRWISNTLLACLPEEYDEHLMTEILKLT